MNILAFCSRRKGRIACVILLSAGLVFIVLSMNAPQAAAPTIEPVATTSTETLAPTTTVPAVVVEDFEGGADINVMALDMKPWKWLSVTYADGDVVTPVKADMFSIRFNASGAFTAETDCNGISGSYEARNGGLSLGSIASTKMFCEGSQEAEFTALLSDVLSYRFADGDKLIMTTANGAEVVFR